MRRRKRGCGDGGDDGSDDDDVTDLLQARPKT